MKTFFIRAAKVAVIFLFVSAVVLTALYVVFKLFGFEAYVISSPSMGQVLREGDIVILCQVPFDELSENDIITFRQSNTNLIITHRISRIDAENGIVFTQGDENEGEDAAPVRSDQIIGRYFIRITALRGLFS